MRSRVVDAVLAVALVIGAAWLGNLVYHNHFGGHVERADPAWQGSISTEGNVTTVVNESGSVWGGAAMLVEEASIGAEGGDDPYLFGQVRSVTATADHIIVADIQVPAVRVYDFQGVYLHDLGGAGEGPGEYRSPSSVRTHRRDRVFVRDDGHYLVHLYDVDGAYLETWDTQHRVSTFTQMTITRDGRLITWVSMPGDNGAERLRGLRVFGAEGPLGAVIVPPTFDFEPVRVLAEYGSRNGVRFPPQYPNLHWTLDSSERMIAGVATDYQFEMRSPDGSTVIVEKYWDPVPIPEQERSDVQARLTTWAREIDPEWTWEIPPIPQHKPPFGGLVSARSGEVWVLRSMESRRMADCVEDAIGFVECWQQDAVYDVFEAGGRFLGAVTAPRGQITYLDPHIDGDVFIAVIEDEAGTIMVKRYRLVLPGGETS